MTNRKAIVSLIAAIAFIFYQGHEVWAKSPNPPSLTARSAVVVDPKNGGVLKNRSFWNLRN